MLTLNLAEVHFGVMNKGGRGIHSGMGTCTCNDMMQCTCFPFLEETRGSPEVANKNGNLTTYFRKDRNNHPPPPPPKPTKGIIHTTSVPVFAYRNFYCTFPHF